MLSKFAEDLGPPIGATSSSAVAAGATVGGDSPSTCPSKNLASVFAGFDNTMILSMGRVAYFGAATAMGAYFAEAGCPCPSGTNVAEFVLDQVNRDFTAVAGVTQKIGRAHV